ncbi:MAG: cation:proton antiporter [Solirubrobacterales bacterium]
MGDELTPVELSIVVLGDLALILVVARIAGALALRINQPRVVGEILGGLCIGPTVLGGTMAVAGGEPSGLVNTLFPPQSFEFLQTIGTVALVLFMFLIGMEIEVKALRARGRPILIVGLATTVVPVAAGFLVGAVLSEPGKWLAEQSVKGIAVSATTHALFIGSAIAVTASAVTSRILQEKRMLTSPAGILFSGAGGIITPLGFLVLGVGVATAEGQGAGGVFASKFAASGLLVATLFLLVRPLLARLIDRRFDPERPLDGELFAVLLFGALITGLLAELAGINAVTGGVLFGTAVPDVSALTQKMIERMQSFLVTLLIPVVLAVSGLQTDLRVLGAEHVIGALFFLAVMVASKWGVGAVAGRAVGLQWKEANAVGVLVNCRGLEILIVAIVGAQLGVLTEPMQGIFVLAAIVTTMMASPLVDFFVSEDEVEEIREQTVAGSIAAMPVMSGGPRVVIAPGEPEASGRALATAEEFLDGDGPRSQFLVVHLIDIPGDGSYVGAAPGEAERQAERALGWLGPIVSRLRAAGSDADPVAFETPTPAADLAKVASDWAATHAVVTRVEDERVLREAGLVVSRAEPALVV